ncbi:MAG: retropepsin-like aspartic protease [Methylocystis sp.]
MKRAFPATSPMPPPVARGPTAEPAMVAMEKDGGVYVVPARFNDVITLPALIDSGAADVSLPPDVVSTLIRSGTISEQDFIGQQTYTLADGSKIPSPKFHIKSIMVGNRTIYNVDAALSPNVETSILLGQSFLGRLQSWSIDNDRHILILK